jgi:hypothetical protein
VCQSSSCPHPGGVLKLGFTSSVVPISERFRLSARPNGYRAAAPALIAALSAQVDLPPGQVVDVEDLLHRDGVLPLPASK